MMGILIEAYTWQKCLLAEGTRWAGGLCLTNDRHLIEMSVGVGNILYYPVFGKTNSWFLFFIYIFK